ncbi:MAG TPA: RtcB family protein [Humisphaera sp.]|nr:RtcB family protein [Humisphaera sp.]
MIEPDETLAPMRAWLAAPMETVARQAIDRMRRGDDVVRIAVMPDVHLAGNFCVGAAVATRRLIYPAAVGGDIGCGMLAVAFDASADILRDAESAGAVLRLLGERIPAQRRHRSRTLPFPATLISSDLSHPPLRSLASDEGQLQFGTLGGGNHFVELQADETGRLWLMIHSGSRAIGQAVKDHHLAQATIRSAAMLALDSDTPPGQAYLHDQEWARRFAHANRQAMAERVIEILRTLFKIEPVDRTTIACDHNQVRREEHFGQSALVHRKGAMPAERGSFGVVPGSMGTLSYHVEGRGCPESLMSSAHGAGRLFSRHAARERFGRADLRRQMHGVWFDPRLSEALREESPKSYKDVRSVMRAQDDLVKVTRILRPLLVYKGR